MSHPQTSQTRLSKVEEAKKLKQDYERLVEEVRDELLSQIEDAIEQLQQIGYHYSLQKFSSPTQVRGRRRPEPTANYDVTKRCMVCSSVGHDGRAHRRQLSERRPFTADELVRLGLCAPEGTVLVEETA